MKAMQLKFEGQTHSIDANTLINVLIHYQSVVNEANRIYSGGSKEIAIKVNAIEKGSFIIDVSVVQNIIGTIFCKDTIEYVASLLGIVGGTYEIYKKFKGKPVKDKSEKDALIKVGGNMSVTINVYNQPVIREAISKSIETLDGDPSVEGLVIKNNKDDKELVTFERNEFKQYIYDDFDKEEDIPDEKIVEEETTLTIVGLGFEKGFRWQFMYEGFKIPIIVKNDALMKKIDEGVKFGKGDSIRVKLRKVMQYNKSYRTYENKSYKIVEFLKLIPAPTSQNLFDNQ